MPPLGKGFLAPGVNLDKQIGHRGSVAGFLSEAKGIRDGSQGTVVGVDTWGSSIIKALSGRIWAKVGIPELGVHAGHAQSNSGSPHVDTEWANVVLLQQTRIQCRAVASETQEQQHTLALPGLRHVIRGVQTCCALRCLGFALTVAEQGSWSG